MGGALGAEVVGRVFHLREESGHCPCRLSCCRLRGDGADGVVAVHQSLPHLGQYMTSCLRHLEQNRHHHDVFPVAAIVAQGISDVRRSRACAFLTSVEPL